MTKGYRLIGWIPSALKWSEPRTIGTFKTEADARAFQKKITKEKGWRARWHAFFVEEI